MSRIGRIAGWVVIGIGIGLLLGFSVIQLLTRTQLGQERVRRLAVGWLADRVHGEVRLGRITGPGLLTGVTLHDVSIHDERGRPLVLIDSARVAYAWRTLLAGRVVFDAITAYSPQLYIERLPGDTLWNFDHIFRDPGPTGEPGPRRLILMEDARIVNGLVVIRRPWEPQPPIMPADTARLILEEVPGGLAEVWRFEEVNGELERILWESPLEAGRLFAIRTLSARGFIWRDPFDLRDARGTVTQVDSIVSFDVPEVRLPASRASVLGQVVLSDHDEFYDVQIQTPDVRFADIQWIYPALPRDGAGSLTLRIQSQRPKGILFLAENARLTAPGTQIAGTLGVVAGDTLYFTAVDLRASPLDIDFLESILPGELPVEGLILGTVEVSGPLSALETRGNVRLSGGPGAGSAVRWSGLLDARGGARGLAARRFTADVDHLNLALVSAIQPEFQVTGSVRGRVEASGRIDRELRVEGNLHHQASDRMASEVQGGGTLRVVDGRMQLDLRLHAQPLSIDEIAALSPSLAGLHGEARGDIHLSGPIQRLSLDADLNTSAGALTIQTLLDREALAGGYAGRGTLSGFRLHDLDPGLPRSTVSGRFAFDLHGSSLIDLTGLVRFELDSARIGGLPLQSGTLDAELADGLLRIDTLTATAPGITLTAGGTFGLIDERQGTISIEAGSASLEALEPLLFDDVVDPTSPRIAGNATASGTVSGTLSRFDLNAQARVERFVYGTARARSLEFGLNGARAPEELADNGTGVSELRLDVAAAGDSIQVARHRFDSATVTLSHVTGTTRMQAGAWEGGLASVRAAGSARHDAGAVAVRVDDLRLGSGEAGWLLQDSALLWIAPRAVRVQDARLRRRDGVGQLSAGGTVAWLNDDDSDVDLRARPLDFTIGATGVAFADLLRLTRREADAGGTLNGRVRITGDADAPAIHGELRIEDLRYEATRLDQVGGRFDYDGSEIATRMDGFHRGRAVLFAEGRVPIDLRFRPVAERRLDRPLDFTLRADSLHAGVVLSLLDGFSNVEGLLDGTITASGTTREPVFGGALALRRGAATWDATGVRYQDAVGTMLVEPGRIVALDLTTRGVDPRTRDVGGRGGARVTGTVDLADPRDPGIDLIIDADQLLAARRRDAELTVSGRMAITDRYTNPEVSGNLRIDGGTLYLDELYRQYLIVGLEDPLLFEVVDTSLVAVRRVLPPTQSPFLKNLRVRDASVSVGSGSWLRSREMNVEVSGDLSIDFDRRREDLRLTGALNVVRGTYRFDYRPFARVFEVRQGTVEFPGTPGIDPNLDITAAHRARTQNEPLEIVARVQGTLQSPRVRLTSDAEPPISESDLASYLFFGAPTYAFNLGSPGSLNGGEGEGGIGRFGLETAYSYGFGYFATGLQTLAQSFGLVDYVGLTAAETTGPQGGQGIGGLLATTEIELGRYLSPSTFVAWTAPLRSPGRSAGFRLEWRFHPTYTAEIFAEDRFARTPSFSLSQTVEARKVYGFFLFRDWGY